MNTSTHPLITFIGGGNMASAIIGGLIRQGHPTSALQVVEPWDEQRAKLAQQFAGMTVLPAASAELKPSDLVVWAVKPQTFKDAAAATREHVTGALHLSVAAGITSQSIAQWLGTERIVRAMPNTPALVGLGMTGLMARSAVSAEDKALVERVAAGITSQSIAAWLGTERIVRAMPNTPALVGLGMTGLMARSAVSAEDKALVERVVRTTGELVWVNVESDLDAVTALSGSGPAYVFYFLEAMRDAGAKMGLSPEVAQQLAIGTFIGAATLAQRSSDPLQTLRERVTSKGGTTYAAITSMESAGVKAKFEEALFAAQERAAELGREFGR